MKTSDVKKALKAKKRKPLSARDFLSTGFTPFDLCLSGHQNGGFAKGKYYHMIGDSDSGKTFLSLTCLAEAAKSKVFRKYRKIFDDIEDGALMDLRRFFGDTLADTIEAPATDADGEPIYSETIEDLYYHVDDALKIAVKTGRPFIYIADSMDGLSSKDEQAKFEEQKRAYRKGREVAGTYGDGKAKKNSGMLRRIRSGLKRTGSILIIISQTRDSFNRLERTRAGGRALKFYATAQMWSSVYKTMKKLVNKKQRQLGIIVRVTVDKNRITGKRRSVRIPIYHSVGIDNIGGCIDYLLEEGHWRKVKGEIDAKEFEVRLKKEALVRHIEEKDLESELKSVVADVWHDIEDACSVQRKPRYA